MYPVSKDPVQGWSCLLSRRRNLQCPSKSYVPVEYWHNRHPFSKKRNKKKYTKFVAMKRSHPEELQLLKPLATDYTPVDIHPNVLTAEMRIKIVRIDAPALSPVVAGVLPPRKLSDADPALLLPTLVPPVAFVTGADAPLSTSSDVTAPSTSICWPAPTLPSKEPLDHWKPHCRAVSPPVH